MAAQPGDHPVSEPQTTIAATILAAAATVTPVLVDTAPTILGVPAGVLLAACAGALFGLAYTPPKLWQDLLAIPEGSAAKRATWVAVRSFSLAFTLAANAIASAWAVSAVPHVPGMGWTGGIPPVPAAGLLAFSAQHVIPHALGFIKRKLGHTEPPA